MSNEDLSKVIFDRLIQQYGHFLTLEELAGELRLSPDALYARRSRGRTGGMPEPLRDITPLQYRSAQVARWLAGEADPSHSQASRPETRRGPGRPRKVPVTEQRSVSGGG